MPTGPSLWIKRAIRQRDEYKGSAAESEIESKALADLLRKEKFTSTISYHTQGEVIYWYFGEGEYVPKARRLAEIVHKNSSYPVIDYYAPQHAGGFKDFAEQKYQIPSLTIECGKGVSPVPEEQIDKNMGMDRREFFRIFFMITWAKMQ